ncbi:MAG TPA: metallophosphoesterase family protein [Patescibacteria group bacterium]
MKTIVFSDTHLHKKFDSKKFRFLRKIIQKADKVIIAGDFWESTIMTFDEFINSEWKQLFPLLKSKKTIYVYGNHDKKNKSDKRAYLFSDLQTEQYIFSENKKTFVIIHGDKLANKLAQAKVVQPIRSLFYTKLFILLIHTNTEKYLTKIFGKQALLILFKYFNYKIKKNLIKTFDKNIILICGHTHAAEIDLKNNFVNTGIIRHGIGQYVQIYRGNVELKQETY